MTMEYPLECVILSATPITDIGSSTASGNGGIVVAPESGEVYRIVLGTDGATDFITTFDIIKNEVDTGVDASLEVLAGPGGAALTIGQRLYVERGDVMYLTSNGEATGPIGGWVTWVFRR